MSNTINKVAVVGSGVIGRSWIQVFLRAGCQVSIFDQDPQGAERARGLVETDLKQDVADGLITAAEAEARTTAMSCCQSLAEALDGAQYVQESGPENLAIKQAIFTELDQLAPAGAILASSTSAMAIQDIAGALPGAARCFTAHPFNPPHILPAVEMMATRDADLELYERAISFLQICGQKPVKMKRFVPGYLANRIQAAVLREAIHLVESGVADAEAVDQVISDSLALRWVLFGNFGTNNTNADGGIREYFTRFGNAYIGLMNDLDSSTPSFDPEMIEQIGKQVDAKEGSASISEICRWRDQLIVKIKQVRDDNPHP
jgi:L-gulonate 3-dehydrogenase